MFVFFSKLLPGLVYPLGLACLLIVAALLLRRRLGWQRLALLLAVLLLWLGGNRWVAFGLARSLEWRYLPPAEIPVAEAIVLLGGGTQTQEYPRLQTEVNEGGDRVILAAWLYRQGKAPVVLASGGLLDWSPRHVTPAQDMAALLEFMGVPAGAIWQQPHSRNTYEDAVFSTQILREKGVRQILLVTSAMHMPRAMLLFQAQGLEVTPVAADFNVTERFDSDDDGWNWRAWLIGLVPSADNLALTTRCLKEYLGILVYALRGWL